MSGTGNNTGINISKNIILCHSCAEEVTDDYISCQGFCNAVFHLRCCGTPPELMKEILTHRQTFWLCNSCSNLMIDLRHRRTVQCAFEAGQELSLSHHNRIVEQLKTEILTELKAELSSNFNRLISSSSHTPGRGSGSSRQQGGRRLFEKVLAPAPREIPGQQPSPPPEGLVAETEKSRFWLYLSRISRKVTEDQIYKLAVDRLGVTDVKVTRLVAKGRDVNRMNFISFKVGMDVNLKSIALSSSTWPEGVVIREFEERSSEKFWEPVGPSGQMLPALENNQSQQNTGPHRPWVQTPPQRNSTPETPKQTSPMITNFSSQDQRQQPN